jgi:hypothetical protein
MGKSDEEQTKKRAHKAIGNSKNKAADGDSKIKKQSSLDTLGSSPFETACEATDGGGARHSRWCELFRQMCEYKVQFGDCLVPKRYSANPKLGKWVAAQRTRYRKITKEKPTSIIAEHIRALNGIGFDCGGLIGAHDFNNCANTRQSSVTASHISTLPTPSSGIGLRLSAETIGCARKEHQIA